MAKKQEEPKPAQVQTQHVEDAVAKEKMPDEAGVRASLGAQRQHLEGLGAAWTAVTGLPARQVIPQVIGTVLKEGGTRPAWQWQTAKEDYVLMAWPKEQPLRASVLLRGLKGEQLKPVSAVPLLEGLPNDLTVETVHPWEQGCGANVGVSMLESGQPMWFYDPLYERDKGDLTVDVTHTFLLSALAFGVRKALLDDITLTNGPAYEAYAQAWLEEHPDQSRLDVPPLKLNVAGKHIIHPGHAFCEYQLRCSVLEVDQAELDNMPITVLYTRFPFEDARPPLELPIYVAKLNLGSFEPKVGDEIDAYVWLQGRVIDWDSSSTDE